MNLTCDATLTILTADADEVMKIMTPLTRGPLTITARPVNGVSESTESTSAPALSVVEFTEVPGGQLPGTVVLLEHGIPYTTRWTGTADQPGGAKHLRYDSTGTPRMWVIPDNWYTVPLEFLREMMTAAQVNPSAESALTALHTQLTRLTDRVEVPGWEDQAMHAQRFKVVRLLTRDENKENP